MSFYVVPLVGTGARGDAFRPKYVPALGVQWLACDLPRHWVIVWADATPAQDATIAANADALVVPPLDNTIALVATQNALEGLGVPAQWLQSGMTYRQVVRVVVGIANFAQRCEGLGQRITLTGNLNLTVAALPAAIQNVLAAAADSMGLDRTGITGATTLRQVLAIMAQQFIAGVSVSLGDL